MAPQPRRGGGRNLTPTPCGGGYRSLTPQPRCGGGRTLNPQPRGEDGTLTPPLGRTPSQIRTLDVTSQKVSFTPKHDFM